MTHVNHKDSWVYQSGRVKSIRDIFSLRSNFKSSYNFELWTFDPCVSNELGAETTVFGRIKRKSVWHT